MIFGKRNLESSFVSYNFEVMLVQKLRISPSHGWINAAVIICTILRKLSS